MKIRNLINRLFTDPKSSKYLILCFCCGVILMLFPSVPKETEHNNAPAASKEGFSLQQEEKRLEEVLSSIQGVDSCKVLLSVNTGTESILAEDEGETVVLSNGGSQSTVTVLTQYPSFQGAVVVTQGYENAGVRFDILSAVMSYTGLGTDKITICPMKE